MKKNAILFRAQIRLLFILALLFMLTFTGCNPVPEAGEDFQLPEPPPLLPEPGEIRTGLLYYPDWQWRFLVPLYRDIPETETIVRHTLEKLFDTPQLRQELELLDLVPLLPEGVSILGIHLEESGLARVDFSSPFLNYDPSRERHVLSGLLCTLRQFPEIERLEIMIDGASPEKFPGGTPGRMPLGPECLINLEIDDALEDYRNYTAVTVYFCFMTPQRRILYVPVTRVLPPSDDAASAAVKELLAGPRRGSGLFSDIPPDTDLRSLQLEDGLMVIDLSKELLDYEGGRTGADNVVNQILLSLAGLEGVNEVQILVEGEKVSLPEGIDLTAPLKPPAVYNYF
ncbi:MAG TPA: GerMN domain-containing protein [Bacillota bacterium]|jgi:germination protein M|nr:hypothetical protein [Bacillota bacterium]HOA35572.1 GerMN domain-containing protein [Bacillota bacterium]HOJ83433.1 GerMN domain-containing protein [Bacillota bacterium]HOL16192.1 GerMN domain-containing protein [Bacillota bacterium]HPZ11709.1 GerMN domain-containing protein [Bacillota bacterium]